MPARANNRRVAAVVVNRNRPDLTDPLVEQLSVFGQKSGGCDVFVIECGSEPEGRSAHESFWYPDPNFSGKAFGHNKGLEFVLRNHGRYEYFWFLMNDLVFDSEPDPVDNLLAVMESEPRMGLLSPTEKSTLYPGATSIPGRSWRKVATCDYLALLIRDECLQQVGFLNPEFKYSWGAIHELAYKMYRAAWFLAYCDKVQMTHLGGTTYGAGTNTPSRETYVKEAKRWAAKYYRSTYGKHWDDLFTAHLPEEIEFNTYRIHRKLWEAENPTSRAKAKAREFLTLLKARV